jgi:23S rRNA (pseudouridine1915-N3)-methyltransferase
MRLLVAAIGRLKRGPESELADRFRERAEKTGRAVAIGPVDIVEVAESRAREPSRRTIEESIALTQLIPEGAAVVLLDRSGQNLTTEGLTAALQSWRDGGKSSLVFIIGGPDGIAPALREKANLVLAFGAVTWPHQLVRVMLLEQIYRGIAVLSGHPYHRG